MSASSRVEIEEREVSSSLDDYLIEEERKNSLRARYYFGLIFFFINLLAWFVRDYAQPFLSNSLLYLKACGIRGEDCFHTLGVLRIFFTIMFVSTVGTRKLYEVRNSWHCGWWAFKFILLVLSLALSFFLPSQIVQIYGEIARIGAGVFLLLQLVSMIHFITWWNKFWTPHEEIKNSCSVGLLVSTIFNGASFCGVVWMYLSYASKASCSLNIFFITWTAILLAVIIAVSLHSKVDRGLLSSGIMALYIVFLCWTAIRSEPIIIRCSSTNPEKANHDWITIIGFLLAIFAIVLAAFSTGIDSKCFQFRRDEVEEEDDIPYKYGFFHLVFSLGAMYFAMLFISWDLNNSPTKWRIDVGWLSTWVKVMNEWFAASFYLWMLISPVVRQNKVTNNIESVQQTTHSAMV